MKKNNLYYLKKKGIYYSVINTLGEDLILTTTIYVRTCLYTYTQAKVLQAKILQLTGEKINFYLNKKTTTNARKSQQQN